MDLLTMDDSHSFIRLLSDSMQMGNISTFYKRAVTAPVVEVYYTTLGLVSHLLTREDGTECWRFVLPPTPTDFGSTNR